MKLYILNTKSLLHKEIFAASYEKCTEDRKRRINSKKLMQDKIRSLGCGILIEKGFRDFGKNSFEILYSERGKPYDKDGEIYFSLSHSGNYCAAAFSDAETGVDIEVQRALSDKLANRFFAPNEALQVVDDDSFLRLWTRKEALAKAFDVPLFEALSQNVISDCGNLLGKDYFLQTFKDEDYTISVCSLKQKANVEIINFSI